MRHEEHDRRSPVNSGAAGAVGDGARSRSRSPLALVALVAQASDTVPPPPHQRPLLITGATLHAVSGPVLVGGRMLIERGRITAIAGAGEALPQPQGAAAEIVDLGGRDVYPGFIAASLPSG